MLEDWIIENYEQMVADGATTFATIATQAEERNAPSLAEWARSKAKAAKPAPAVEAKPKRSAKSDD